MFLYHINVSYAPDLIKQELCQYDMNMEFQAVFNPRNDRGVVPYRVSNGFMYAANKAYSLLHQDQKHYF
jgi:hypothetical protein